MPRPALITDELKAEAVKLAANGIPREVIGPAIGIGRTTFFTWLRYGHPDFTPSETEHVPADLVPYQEFRDAIDHAQTRPIVLCEATMLRAVQGTPAVPEDKKAGTPAIPAIPACAKTAERWLKMHRPDLYRDTVDVNHAGSIGLDASKVIDALAGYNDVIAKLADEQS